MIQLTRSNLVIGLIYGAGLTGLVGGMLLARRQVLVEDDRPAAHAAWHDWRSEVIRQREGDGPVSRRVPRSSEPPSLVLLRDYFVTSTIILVVLSSALYFTLALMFRGVLVGPGFQPDLRDDSSAG